MPMMMTLMGVCEKMLCRSLTRRESRDGDKTEGCEET